MKIVEEINTKARSLTSLKEINILDSKLKGMRKGERQGKYLQGMDEKGDITTSRKRINLNNMREYYMQLYGNKFEHLKKIPNINTRVK